MNKIIVDEVEVVDLNNQKTELVFESTTVVLNVIGDVKATILKCLVDNLNLTINLSKNSSLNFNMFFDKNVTNVDIKINQESKSRVEFNNSFVATNNVSYRIDSVVAGNDNVTELNIKALTKDKGKVRIDATGLIDSDTHNNDFTESIKCLALNDTNNMIIPNLIVNSSDAIVNHNTTISSVEEHFLFYLMSKGLSKLAATELVTKGFLINCLKITEEEKEVLKKIIED